LVAPLGHLSGSHTPQLSLRDEDRQWAENRLQRENVLDGRILIGMNPGATYGLAKCWSPRRFGELGERLAQRRRLSVLLFGKEEERSIGSDIFHRLQGIGIDLMGKTGLLQLAALLEKCHLLVTNDTGTMHVAAAVGTPVVALFGPTNPQTTGPCGEGHRIIKKNVSCSPCYQRVCPTDHRCMEGISVDEVEEIVNGRIREIQP